MIDVTEVIRTLGKKIDAIKQMIAEQNRPPLAPTTQYKRGIIDGLRIAIRVLQEAEKAARLAAPPPPDQP